MKRWLLKVVLRVLLCCGSMNLTLFMLTEPGQYVNEWPTVVFVTVCLAMLVLVCEWLNTIDQ